MHVVAPGEPHCSRRSAMLHGTNRAACRLTPGLQPRSEEHVSQPKQTVIVRHNSAQQRFEAVINGLLCHADYRMDGETMAMVHTEVPEALEGRGIAAQLVRAAIEHARAS